MSESCPICAQLRDKEYSYRKYGWEDETVTLPKAASELTVIRDFKPQASRAKKLYRCPVCGTHYLYESDYEYLVNGTEDEEFLTRLTDEEAGRYLE